MIPVPPLEEQRRIVARLEARLGASAAVRERMKAQAADLERTFRKFFDDQLRDHADAEPLRLGDLLAEADYGTSVKCHPERHEGDVPVLRIPNVASETINLTDLKYAPSGGAYPRVEDGDLLLVRTNGSRDLVGRCACVDAGTAGMSFASYLIRLRFSSALRPDFAQWILRHLRESGGLINTANASAGQFNISLGRISEARIGVPSLEEQDRILARLDAVEREADAARAAIAATLAELDLFDAATLREAFA